MFKQHARESDENTAPPPLPSTEPPPLDPDYEVIEFPGQAYTNAPLPTKPATSGMYRQFVQLVIKLVAVSHSGVLLI